MVIKEVAEENNGQEKEGPEAKLLARLTEFDAIENLIEFSAFNRVEASQHGREFPGVNPLDQLSRWNACWRTDHQRQTG